MALSPVQVRILGCMLEKERTTPDNYPLTMNGLLSACNQTSNRFPVVHLDEATVENALQNLRAENLVRIVYSRSNRAEKFRHVLDEALGLDAPDMALLAVLMLRGPQTSSELRARTERLHRFEDQAEVDDGLRRLATRDEPLVALLERQPGQKENRWAQLLGGELPAGERATPADAQGPSRADRLTALEETVETLRQELSRLRAEHEALAAQLT
ncbi:MAG: YceH family protein [Actinomycetota bacterium]|nr:YceH family protein [Actinomycetota bacterium]